MLVSLVVTNSVAVEVDVGTYNTLTSVLATDNQHLRDLSSASSKSIPRQRHCFPDGRRLDTKELGAVSSGRNLCFRLGDNSGDYRTESSGRTRGRLCNR